MNPSTVAQRPAHVAERQTVLVADDTPANLHLLAGLLDPHYRVLVAPGGAKALELAVRSAPDLIVLDVMMPGIDGYEVCRRLKADPRTAHVPVLFLTALTQPEDETAGFEAGGADFIQKPFNPATVLARVRVHLAAKSWQDALRDRNAWLRGELEVRLAEVDRLRDGTLFVMIGLAEFRDSDTGHHIKRTQEYVRTLAQWRLEQPDAPAELTPLAVAEMASSAPLHDIGKVAIPDSILLKKGALTADEWDVMRTHSAQGGDLLLRAAERLGEQAGPFLRYGIEIARHHHEKWNGSGYPDGLVGEAIPLSARVMAVADVYDALLSPRPYKNAWTEADAMAELRRGAGTHFDPRLIEGLFECRARFAEIASQWKD